MDIEEVISLATIATLTTDDALQAIAQLVDYSCTRPVVVSVASDLGTAGALSWLPGKQARRFKRP